METTKTPVCPAETHVPCSSSRLHEGPAGGRCVGALHHLKQEDLVFLNKQGALR